MKKSGKQTNSKKNWETDRVKHFVQHTFLNSTVIVPNKKKLWNFEDNRERNRPKNLENTKPPLKWDKNIKGNLNNSTL